MSRNRFVNIDELQEVDMGDGDWIKIPKQIPFQFLEEIEVLKAQGGGYLSKVLPKIIRAWNFKGPKDEIMPITTETIRSLDLKTMEQISNAIAPLLDTTDPKAPSA